jgi:DNA-directed RNA polymerase II subunit RPB7
MGFFRRRLQRTVSVHPQHLGAGLLAHVKAQAAREATAEGVGEAGYIVTTLNIPDEFVVSGAIDHLTGAVRFAVTFDAVCFKPLRNEVLDAVVQQCTGQGLFAEAGPFSVFVHNVGDLEFRADEMAWVSAETGLAIKAGAAVRLKIMGVNTALGARQIGSIGTINEPFLGLLA